MSDIHERQCVIEEARSSDEEAIAALFRKDLLDQQLVPADEEPSLDELRDVVRSVLADRRRASLLRVARCPASDDVAGVLLACEITSIKFPGPALWIEELYVHPDFRRRGLARRLVDNLLDWAMKQGYRGIELEAYRMNTGASILYRSLGFRRLPRERYTYDLRRDEPLPLSLDVKAR